MIHVTASHDDTRQATLVRVVRSTDGERYAYVGGEWSAVQPGQEIPATYVIPDEWLPEFRAALGHSTNAALEESLYVERQRVNSILSKVVDFWTTS